LWGANATDLPRTGRASKRQWIEVNPQTCEVRADGVPLACRPAFELPMARRDFLV
jgi:urease alpha subunit